VNRQSKQYPWIILGILLLAFGGGFFSLDIMPPLFMEISHDFPLSKTQMGAVIAAFHLASPIFTPIGGVMVDRLGPRRMLLVASLIVGVAGAMRFMASDASQLIAIMFLMGVGFSSFGPTIPKALGSVFRPEHLARANGLVFSGIGMGNALALSTAATVLSPALGGWRPTVIVVGVASALVGLVWFLVFRDSEVTEQESADRESVAQQIRRVAGVSDVWVLAAFYALPAIAYWGVLAILPPTLGERGISNPGIYVAIMTGTSVVANILGGMLSDWLGLRRPVLLVCSLGLGAMIPLMLMFDGTALVFVMIAAGIFFGPIIPIAVTVPVELPTIGTHHAGTAVGLMFMGGNVGATIGPLAVGALIDTFGTPWAGFGFAAAALFLTVIPLAKLTETGSRVNPHAGSITSAAGH